MSELRNTTRRMSSAIAIGAIGFAVALGTTGCGAGQVSQTANQLPAVNGALGQTQDLLIREAAIIYPAEKADEVFGDGGPFELTFAIINQGQLNPDRLVSITAAQGTVKIEGDATIAPGGALHAGTPAGLLVPTDSPAGEEEERITVTLTDAGDTVAPGLTTPLTFKFANAPEITINTPVNAGTLERQDKARQAEPPAYDQLHEGGH